MPHLGGIVDKKKSDNDLSLPFKNQPDKLMGAMKLFILAINGVDRNG